MGQIVGSFATSHAFAFMAPSKWDDFGSLNREFYRKRYGTEPQTHAELDSETTVDNERRYERVRLAHDRLRAEITGKRPDLLILIGHDQDENLTSRNLPQLAVYAGADFRLTSRYARTAARYRTHVEVAAAILEQAARDGFDLASLGAFEDRELKSHAHAQVLDALMPDAQVPMVLFFLNAIHHPAVTPRRYYAVGELLRRVIEERPADERVMIGASGGLSHFTAGYPWSHYRGAFGYGDICQDFDRSLIRRIEAGEGRELANLTSEELMEHGAIEFRAWLALLGAIGAVPTASIVYEPFYRAIMGMGVASRPETTPR
jgi:aromatic ring-opening dioxygenase catalytic subunit (LigB family)